MPDARAVFVFEGYADDVSVHRSIEDAADYAEVFDLAILTFLTDDGTVLRSEAQGYQVILTATAETRRDDLVARLKRIAEGRRQRVPVGSEDDPYAYAVLFGGRGWHRR